MFREHISHNLLPILAVALSLRSHVLHRFIANWSHPFRFYFSTEVTMQSQYSPSSPCEVLCLYMYMQIYKRVKLDTYVPTCKIIGLNLFVNTSVNTSSVIQRTLSHY